MGTGLAAQAHQQLRASILQGEYSPGEFLSENAVAEKLGMSRTPVREALQTLAREGFLESIPARGFCVPRWSMEDIREMFELRECLEGYAARCAALRASEDDIKELERLYQISVQAKTWQEWVQTGTEFHHYIFSIARNHRLSAALNALNAQIILTRRSELRDIEGRREEAVKEHKAFLDAIQAHDPDKAEQLARRHIRHSYEATLHRFQSGL